MLTNHWSLVTASWLVQRPRIFLHEGVEMNQQVGQRFPDFDLPDHEGQPVKLSEVAGKFPLILSFYRGYW